ncbi:hypothetical protein C1645_828812 [Glomus cerebriforme]|uniref:Protein kinase domain-containing protein n=1 Tax=Glomus cerebriforme TaxID=658196 RepID=A0A397SQ49_9GLOM|nr:hypothetical protein C1645_828812 [Glomus cerebriforme]
MTTPPPESQILSPIPTSYNNIESTIRKRIILDDKSLTKDEKTEATFMPGMIMEWIPYGNLQNIKYLTKGGYSEIYIAEWIDEHYIEWDSNEQQLKRFGTYDVILKILKNVGSANQKIHQENAIFRDSHSENILYSQLNDYWRISDLGLCGPADKPLLPPIFIAK